MAIKSTGIIRKIDELGRIVIPMEVRRTFGIEIKDPLEIFVDKERIVLSKYTDACVFCGSGKKLTSFKGKKICSSCTKAVYKN